jgi:hypothetical protein
MESTSVTADITVANTAQSSAVTLYGVILMAADSEQTGKEAMHLAHMLL